MRNILILTAFVAAVIGPIVPAAGASGRDASARYNARVTAVTDCNRQARAMQFGRRIVQRRNFVKECMIDRGFPAQTN